MRLSNVDYLHWRDCRHNAWWRLYAPDVYYTRPQSAFDRSLVDAGIEVSALARRLFADGIAAARVAQRAAVLFQPAFATDTMVVTPDILAWNGAAYDLYVVMASTGGDDKSAKDDRHAHDLGFQAHALGSLCVPLGQLLLMRLNRDYVRRGELELEQLFTREDFTERVKVLLREIAIEVRAAHADLAQAAPLVGPCGCMFKGGRWRVLSPIDPGPSAVRSVSATSPSARLSAT